MTQLLSTNEDFGRLLSFLKAEDEKACIRSEDTEEYQRFIQIFPPYRLSELTLDEYCVGKGDSASFCWWIERGLVPALGRYMPGTAKGHILYFQPDGSLYKHRHLAGLSDQEALRYTLKIQSTIANAEPESWGDVDGELSWVDDDKLIYRRAGVEPRVTIGDGRKLRLLSCYYPDRTLPISSSDHLSHYLRKLGCSEQDIPRSNMPVARMLKLREYYQLACESVPGLSPYGFMRGLYSDELGLAPVKEQLAPDDEEAPSVFVPIHLGHGDRVDWAKTTHVRLTGLYADTPKAQESLDFIASHAGDSGIAAIADLEAAFPGRLRAQKGQQGAMRFDLRHFGNSRGNGDNPQDKGLLELGYMGKHVDSHEVPSAVQCRAPLNQILYGPPGTGKTYATVEAALEVLDSRALLEHRQDRVALKRRFDQLVDEGRIRFVTFHQSFSYEDFVEGLRAESDEVSGQLRYEVVDGVFKSLCEVAGAQVTQQAEAPVELGKRKIWKMSLGNTLGSDAGVYEECVQGGYVLLGYGGNVDFSGCISRSDVQQRFVEAGVALDGPNDYSLTSVSAFVTKMKEGDLVVVSDGNFKFRAVGEITGSYSFKPHPDYEADYSQMRPVRWLRQYSPSLPHSELLNGQFSQMTLYELRSPTLNRERLQVLLGGQVKAGNGNAFSAGQVYGRDYQVVRATADLLELKKPNGNLLGLSLSLLNELAEAVRTGQITLQDIREKTAIEKLPGTTLEPYLVNGYNNILAPLVEHLIGASEVEHAAEAVADARVLIIDEINRGNVSRIFGELITLIEPSKRAGADEELSVVLPYSKERFKVPKNVYLIGTMNTSDRSLAGLDIALRRRFVFREMPPQPELLEGVEVAGVNIGHLLRVMNQRIEVLLDRDHCLGHAYFMSLKSGDSLEQLASIFRNQILPLLQEYFFEDWERIGWVLNDQQAKSNGTEPFVLRPQSEQSLTELFGSEVAGKLNDQRWVLNDAAVESVASYRNILG